MADIFRDSYIFDMAFGANKGHIIDDFILNEFYAELYNGGLEENALSKSTLTDYFQKFMASRYSDVKLEELFQEKIKLDKKASFEDFVYTDCMRLRNGVAKEFQKQRDKVAGFCASIAEKRSIINNDETKNAEEKKYWNLQANGITKYIDKNMGISYMLRQSISKCRIKDSAQVVRDSEEERYVKSKISSLNRTWRGLICFGDLTVERAKEMVDMREKAPSLYILKFRQFAETALYKTIDISQNNYYIKGRCNIFNSAKEAFESKNSIALFYTLVPQVEGLFKTYMKIIGLDSQISKFSGLGEALKKVYPDDSYWEYVYFYFGFRKIRNSVLHGDVIEITEENAYEIVMALYWIVLQIDDDGMEYKQWVGFLDRRIKTKAHITKVMDGVLSFFAKQYFWRGGIDPLAMLDKWIKGKYKDIMEFYGVYECGKILKDILSSQRFLDRIWRKNTPVEIIEDEKLFDERDGVDITENKTVSDMTVTPCKMLRINDYPLNYQDLVCTLYNHNLIRKDWYDGYDNFCKEVKRKREEYRKYFAANTCHNQPSWRQNCQ